MYTLRTMLTNQTEHNQMLGKSYVTVLRRMAPKEFERLSINYDKRPDGELAGFVISEGNEMFPIWSGIDHYIMTDGGKTLTHIHEYALPKGETSTKL